MLLYVKKKVGNRSSLSSVSVRFEVVISAFTFNYSVTL